MRRTSLLPLLLAGLAAVGPAAAHNVAVLPSRCTFEPLAITAPGTAVAVTPAAAADELVLTYDTGASQVTFDLRSCPPRPLDAAGTPGTLDLPDVFQAALFATGDLTVAAVPFDLSLGAASATLPVALTTGLAMLGGNVIEGAPLGADGRFTLAGGVASLGLAPFGGVPVGFRLTCQAAPVPDLDQFRLAPEMRKLSGTIRNGVLALKAQLVVSDGDAPDLTGVPAVVRASGNELTVAATAFEGGLARRGKAFVATAADGATISVRVVRRKAPAKLALKARLPGAAIPPGAGNVAQVTADVGGLLARARGDIVRKGGRVLIRP